MVETLVREEAAGSGLADAGPQTVRRENAGHREALDGIARLAAEGLGSAATLVSVLGAERPFLRSEVGLPLPMVSKGETPLLDALCLEVAAHQGPVRIADANREGGEEAGRLVRRLGLRSCLGIALARDGRLPLGSLCAVAETPRRWTRTEVDLFGELAGLAAAEIATNGPSGSGEPPGLGLIRLELNLAFAGSGGLQESLGAAIEASCRALGWDLGCAWLADGDAEELRCAATWQRRSDGLAAFAEICAALSLAGDREIVAEVQGRRRPAWSPDLTEVEGFSRGVVAAAADLRCGAWVPLLAGEEALGTLELLGRSPHPIHEEVAPRLLELGRQIGGLIALRRSDLGAAVPVSIRRAQGPFRGLPDARWW